MGGNVSQRHGVLIYGNILNLFYEYDEQNMFFRMKSQRNEQSEICNLKHAVVVKVTYIIPGHVWHLASARACWIVFLATKQCSGVPRSYTILLHWRVFA